MNIELGQLPDGSLVMGCANALSPSLCRIEVVRDQKVLRLVYEGIDDDEGYLPWEVQNDNLAHLADAPSILVVHEEHAVLKGYDVPLIQVGL